MRRTPEEFDDMRDEFHNYTRPDCRAGICGEDHCATCNPPEAPEMCRNCERMLDDCECEPINEVGILARSSMVEQPVYNGQVDGSSPSAPNITSSTQPYYLPRDATTITFQEACAIVYGRVL
jgi:hypothetical protein